MKYTFFHPDHYLIEVIAGTDYGKMTPEGKVVGMSGLIREHDLVLIDLSDDKIVARYDFNDDKLYSDLDLLSLSELIPVHPSYKEHLIDQIMDDMLFYHYTNSN